MIYPDEVYTFPDRDLGKEVYITIVSLENERTNTADIVVSHPGGTMIVVLLPMT